MAGLGLTAAFTVGLVFLGDARWGCFLATFDLIVLGFLAPAVFLRGAVLVTDRFLRLVFLLTFVLVAIPTSPNTHLGLLEPGGEAHQIAPRVATVLRSATIAQFGVIGNLASVIKTTAVLLFDSRR